MEFSVDMLQAKSKAGVHITSRSKRHKPAEGHCLLKLWFSLALGLSAPEETTVNMLFLDPQCLGHMSCGLSKMNFNVVFPENT